MRSSPPVVVSSGPDPAQASGPPDGFPPGQKRNRTAPSWFRPSILLPPVIAVAALGVAWQLYAIRNPYVIPRLQAIFDDLGNRPDLYLRNALTTLEEALVGAAIGMGAAFLLAVVMSFVKMFERALLPLAVVLNVTPVIAVAPALVVAFGFGETPKYVITAVLVFFPFLINSLMGLRSVDPQALDVLKTLHASHSEIMRKLRLPSSLPFLFCSSSDLHAPEPDRGGGGRIRGRRDGERTRHAHRDSGIPRRPEDHLRLGVRPVCDGSRAVPPGRLRPEPSVDLAQLCSTQRWVRGRT